MFKGLVIVKKVLVVAFFAGLILFSGVMYGGCEKKKEAVYTIGPENVPDLEKGEQEVKGEKAVNPLEATKEGSAQTSESSKEEDEEKK